MTAVTDRRKPIELVADAATKLGFAESSSFSEAVEELMRQALNEHVGVEVVARRFLDHANLEHSAGQTSGSPH